MDEALDTFSSSGKTKEELDELVDWFMKAEEEEIDWQKLIEKNREYAPKKVVG